MCARVCGGNGWDAGDRQSDRQTDKARQTEDENAVVIVYAV